LLSLALDAYTRHISNPHARLANYQSPFREALFSLQAGIKHVIIPSTVMCRYEGGCNDACLTIHRSYDLNKSGANVRTKAEADRDKKIKAQ
jgi:hypothetical protein